INWVHDRTATYAAQWSVRTRLLADRADNAALGPRIVRRQLVFVREHFIVLRHRGYLTLRHHVHHLVTARLELADQFGDRLGGVVLEIVYQDDAFAVLFELAHHRFNHVFGLVQLEVTGVDVGRERPDIALGQVRQELRRMLQGRK